MYMSAMRARTRAYVLYICVCVENYLNGAHRMQYSLKLFCKLWPEWRPVGEFFFSFCCREIHPNSEKSQQNWGNIEKFTSSGLQPAPAAILSSFNWTFALSVSSVQCTHTHTHCMRKCAMDEEIIIIIIVTEHKKKCARKHSLTFE